MASPAREIEWQFDAVDLRPVERWLSQRPASARPAVEPNGAHVFADTYLDTDDWRLHRAGFSLRVRSVDGRREATLKSRAAEAGALRDRIELTQPVDSGDPASLFRGRGEVSDRLHSLVGPRPLHPLFELTTRRRTYVVRLDDNPPAELSLDDTAIATDDGPPVRMQRVEIEASSRESVPALESFVAEIQGGCALADAATTKFQAGLLARGLTPPAATDVGPTTLERDPSVADVAFAVLRRQFVSFLEHEAGARLGEDPEEVHDMRVATRRMRAAMSLFSGALPVRFASFRKELKWVASSLGEVRDLDVQLEQAHDWTEDLDPSDARALRSLVSMLTRRRKQARSRLLRTLDSRRYARLVSALTDALRHGPVQRSMAARTPVTLAAPDLVGRRHRKLRKTGDVLRTTSAPEEFHALRIRGKRLRYALEFLSEIYPESTKPMIKRLVELQDLLGEHQDAQVALGHLRTIVDRRAGGVPPRGLFVLGRITERNERRAADLRERFPETYDRLRGKPWKRLRREMQRRRPPAGPAGPRSAPADSVRV